jgi:hypothetical protein
MKPYEVYAIRYATRDAKRPVHFVGGDPHDSPMPMDYLKPLFNNHFVLEIKYYTDQMPLWARSLVQEYKLRCDAISKYTIGYDVNKFNQKITY